MNRSIPRVESRYIMGSTFLMHLIVSKVKQRGTNIVILGNIVNKSSESLPYSAEIDFRHQIVVRLLDKSKNTAVDP